MQTWGVHNVTETLEVDVLIDAGADGVFADEELQADYMAVKLAARVARSASSTSPLPAPFDECAASVLRRLQQLQQQPRRVGGGCSGDRVGRRRVRARVPASTACTGTFSGDVPGTVCDTAGEIDGDSGTWNLVFDAADPALVIDPLVCKGFWDGGDCDDIDPIDVSVGTAGTDDDPSILALFPNDGPHRTATVVETNTVVKRSICGRGRPSAVLGPQSRSVSGLSSPPDATFGSHGS